MAKTAEAVRIPNEPLNPYHPGMQATLDGHPA
jgi:hypothetical protein